MALLVWVGSTLLIATEGLRCDRSRSLSICDGWVFASVPGDTEFVLDSDTAAAVAIDTRLVVAGRGGAPSKGVKNLTPGPRAISIREEFPGARPATVLWRPPGAAFEPLDSREFSTRPLSRAEHRLRRIARAARVAALLLFVGTLLLLWPSELTHIGRRIAAPVIRAHAAIVPKPPRALIALIGVSVAARLIMTLTTHPILWPDSDSYYHSAREMLRGNWASHEVFRTPGYSAFMALFLSAGDQPSAGAALILSQRLLGILTALLVYDIGWAAFSPGVAFYGAAIWTLSPLPLYYESVVGTEALFVFALMLTMWAAVRLLDTSRAFSFAVVGLFCAASVLTRPVARGIIVPLLAIAWWCHRRRPRHAIAMVAAAVAAYAACIVPWMYVNKTQLGFFGISRGEGLGLFMRAYDIERFPPPQSTRFTQVDEAYHDLRPSYPYMHYAIRDELNYRRRLSAAQTDVAMEGYALEAIRAHPAAFVAGVAMDWAALFVAPHRSVGVCSGSHGPELCDERHPDTTAPAFPSRSFSPFVLKGAVAAYFTEVYGLMAFLAPLAVVGAAVSLSRRHDARTRMLRLLLVIIVLYFSIVSVTFNTIEDRYRLPIDPFIVLLACAAAGRSQNNATRYSSAARSTA